MQSFLVRSVSAPEPPKNRIHGSACEWAADGDSRHPAVGQLAERHRPCPLSCPKRDGTSRSSNPPDRRHPAHLGGLASARAPAKGTILTNVRTKLTMFAISGVLATTPFTLATATAFADDVDANASAAPVDPALPRRGCAVSCRPGAGPDADAPPPFDPAGDAPAPDWPRRRAGDAPRTRRPRQLRGCPAGTRARARPGPIA